MKKTFFSRRDFLKGAAASAATVAAAGLVGGIAMAEGEAIYTPGTYSATATGMGEVTVTMTFDETKITDVVVDVSNETPEIGQLHGETLKEALAKARNEQEQIGQTNKKLSTGMFVTDTKQCISCKYDWKKQEQKYCR